MKFLPRDECVSWVKARRPDLAAVCSADGMTSQPGSRSLTMHLSSTTRSTFYLAKVLVRWIEPFGSCLLWMTEYGIWPSSECPELFRRLRSTYSESRNIAEAPGHVAESAEKDQLEIFVALAIQFGWGGYLVSDKGAAWLAIDHDGDVHVHGKSDWTSELQEAMDLSISVEVAPLEQGRQGQVLQ